MTPAETPPVAESVEVTQADREALSSATAYYHAHSKPLDQISPTMDEIIVAHRNACEGAAAIIARHRLAAYEAGRAEGVRAAAEVRAALVQAEDAMNEMFRYFDGGETRGSYDGKPERAQLRKAWYRLRALSKEPTK